MYEFKHQPLLPLRHFMKRMGLHIVAALGLVLLTVLAGVAGHLWLEPVVWHDAVLNISLIVSGIGPFILPTTVAGKLFFSFYGIIIGLVFAATLGLILAPVAHRLIHTFHLDNTNDQG